MCDINNWLTKRPMWCDDELNLLFKNYINNKMPKIQSVKDIICKSEKFFTKFPIDTARNKTLINTVSKDILERNIQSTYPIIHEEVLNLCAKFLLLKLEYGSDVEKKYYKNIGVLELIERFLIKRAVSFLGSLDFYRLRNGKEGYGKWKTIGTNAEKSPLLLKDYLSYDELKLSALLSVSSYTYFINDGSRNNNGKVTEDRNDIQSEGIIIGLIGPRLVKKFAMEFEEIAIVNDQNIAANGYGNMTDICQNIHTLMANFYRENSHLYNNVRYGPTVDNKKHFKELQNGIIFDNFTYAKRLAISFDTLLLEANSRAKIENKFAYVHLVGIGLGVWRLTGHQEDVFVETFGKRLRALGDMTHTISDVHFSYFPRTATCLNVTDGNILQVDGHPRGGIKIHISLREPYTKLEDPDKLLIVSYAWDGNALPGNEYWVGCLANSGDSSTASSCQVTELHNPFINEMVSVNNLMIATSNGLISIHEYIEQMKRN